MKYVPFILIWFIIILSLFQNCANPISPSGGPKDTIPPNLLSSRPTTGTLNYQGKTIRLNFDEYINTDRLKTNLIITPSIEDQYSITTKKFSLLLKFPSQFDDSTTYTLNFFNGVTDITERTPAENLVIAFSTGNFIDSLSASGSIKDLLTQKPVPDMLLGLYPYNDTLDYAQDKPKYFIKTDEKGNFNISYIKHDYYKVFAFQDDNNNLLFDSETESHAFISGTQSLTDSAQSYNLNSILLDVTPNQFITARPAGNYFQARYKKNIKDYEVTMPDSLYTIYSRLNTDLQSIRFYPQPEYPDSLKVIIQTTDTIQNITKDTVFLKFNDSKRKTEPFTFTLNKRDGTSFNDTLKTEIIFNKPVKFYRLSETDIMADTILSIPLSEFNPTTTWNHDFTRLSVVIPFDWQAYQDSVLSTMINLFQGDTTFNSEEVNINFMQLSLNKGAFISVENDSSLVLTSTYKKALPLETGNIIYSIETTQPSYYVQLINTEYKSIQQIYNQPSGTFTKVPPGRYGLRVLIDNDNDGKWSYGSLKKDVAPEQVYVLDVFTELRANWDIELEGLVIDNL